nr:DNA repair protein RadB [Candidatus Undinarchaeales archaeon ERR594346 U_76725]
QKSIISQLQRFVDYKCRLIVLDSAVSLYRLENSGSRNDMLDNSRELGRQMAQLSKIARQNQVPIIVCNQVYESFRKKGSVEPVGRDVMAYWSKTALELGRKGSSRWARLARHPSKKAGEQSKFKIHNEGIR